MNFKIIFNSGNTDALTLTHDSNVIDRVVINDSDNAYYKDAQIRIVDLEPSQEDVIRINSTAHIYISGSLEFSGYVSRVRKSLAGTKVFDIQCVGKTYDLWRYRVSSGTFEDTYSHYIVSRLIADNTPITPPALYANSGTYIAEIDFTDYVVGDAIAKLAKLDGYKFYVDESDSFVYYKPEDNTPQFTIKDSDIIKMTPYETGDDKLVNAILVIGGSGYSDVVSQPRHSKSKVIPSGVLIAQRFKATKDRLGGVKLYLGRTEGDNQPTTLNFEIWQSADEVFEDDFTDESKLSTKGEYNMTVDSSYLQLEPSGSGYYTSGSVRTVLIQSPAKYIQVDLDDMEHYDDISISGTNDSGSTFIPIKSGQWWEFSSQSDNVFIRYWFTSDGSYTPKINKHYIRTADSDSLASLVAYESDFTDYESNFNYNNLIVENSRLRISGSNELFYVYPSRAIQIDGSTSWENQSYMYDHDENTYAEGDLLTDAPWSIDEYKFSSAVCVYGIWDKADTSTSDSVYMDYWYISGQYTNGWYHARETNTEIFNGSSFSPGPYYADSQPRYFTDIKKYRIKIYGLHAPWYYKLRAYETKVQCFHKITISGSMESNSPIYLSSKIDYLKIDAITGDRLDKITISASADDGAHWTKLSSERTKVYPGSSLRIKIYMKPWYGSGSYYPNTPRLNYLKITGYYIDAENTPLSGSKLEWSDDISFSASDVPYQPSWSAWQNYTSPKLKLTPNNYYWIVISHPSGSGKYWEYYWSPSSQYEYGKIMYSDDGGVTWKDYYDDSSIPSGSMAFKLGFGGGNISYYKENPLSISKHGRHFKKVTESSITTLEDAQAYADAYLSKYASGSKTGRLVIKGRTNIDITRPFTFSSARLGISEDLPLASYTQSIDRNGFLTTLNYGEHPYDIVAEVERLKRKVETGD